MNGGRKVHGGRRQPGGAPKFVIGVFGPTTDSRKNSTAKLTATIRYRVLDKFFTFLASTSHYKARFIICQYILRELVASWKIVLHFIILAG